jgi:hypothetical protein
MDCLKIDRDCQVHIECGAVLLADQNARIFDDWKLQITSFNSTEGRYVFFQRNKPGSCLIVVFVIVDAVFIFLSQFLCYLNE